MEQSPAGMYTELNTLFSEIKDETSIDVGFDGIRTEYLGPDVPAAMLGVYSSSGIHTNLLINPNVFPYLSDYEKKIALFHENIHEKQMKGYLAETVGTKDPKLKRILDMPVYDKDLIEGEAQSLTNKFYPNNLGIYEEEVEKYENFLRANGVDTVDSRHLINGATLDKGSSPYTSPLTKYDNSSSYTEIGTFENGAKYILKTNCQDKDAIGFLRENMLEKHFGKIKEYSLIPAGKYALCESSYSEN